MHYALVMGSSYKIWSPQGIPKQYDLWLTLADPYMTFDPIDLLHFVQEFLSTKFGSHIGHF